MSYLRYKLIPLLLFVMPFQYVQASSPENTPLRTKPYKLLSVHSLETDESWFGVHLGFSSATASFSYPGGVKPEMQPIFRMQMGFDFLHKLGAVPNLFYGGALNLYDGKGVFQKAPAGSGTKDVTLRLNYFSINPDVKYFFPVGEKFHPFVSMGMYWGLLYKATIELGDNDPERVASGALKSSDWGLTFGLGTLVDLNEYSKLSFKMQLNPGIYNIEGDDSAAKNQSSYTRQFTFSVGYFANIQGLHVILGR